MVSSGEEALERAGTDRPDLILMDILLAGQMDGIEAAKQIQSNLDIPIVFVTAYDDQEKLDRAKLLNPAGYILKPYNDRQIKVSIEMALYVSKVEKERQQAEKLLLESERRVKLKLDTILKPEGDIGPLDFADIIDTQAIQSIMDDFYSLTNIGVGILDLKGQVLVATGWQDICTKFHRVHPEACKHCQESDTVLSNEVEPGAFKIYRCKNNMWDIVTPVFVGANHVGNLFLGQFLFAEELPNYDLFRAQARQYGFAEEEYLAALQRVPRWSKEKVHTVMDFYSKFAVLVSALGYSNIKQARLLTERDKLVHSLLNSNERYQALIKTSMEGFWAVDLEGRIMEVNDAYCAMSGYSREALVSMRISDLEFIESPEQVIAHIQNIDAQGWDRFESKHRCSDGSIIDVHASTFFVASQGLIIAFMSNITERNKKDEEHKKMESQLRQAQKMEAIGTLAGGIAHDFNNILGAIMGYTQLAMTEASPGSQLYDFLKEVFNGGHRAKDLIKQILTFSRQSEQSKQPFLIGTVLKEAIKLLRASLPSTIEIRQNIAHQVGPVLGDPTQIHQVLMNLCTNASQAMADKGGVLGIGLEEVTVTSEQASSMGLEAGEYVCLRVSDTGPGIAKGILDRIFEPYFTTKGIGEGTGLGLSTVLGIVESHGGVIKLNPESGAGTTFSIYLPRHFSDTKPVENNQDPIESGVEKILLIDDEKSLAEMGSRMLKRLGYQVTMRTSSLEALELFRLHPDWFDLVITDQTMPQMTGMGLTKELLKIRPDIPVILCTGFSSAVTPDTIKAVGIQGILMKPVIMEELAKTIRAILEKRDPKNLLSVFQ